MESDKYYSMRLKSFGGKCNILGKIVLYFVNKRLKKGATEKEVQEIASKLLKFKKILF